MEDVPDIHWGPLKLFVSKSKIAYSSFFSEGEEYTLYDNVEVYADVDKDPYIGKIMKLWEDRENGSKKALIRWFFRPRDLELQTSDPKELYLAFGKGKGVTNENDLEVICGKCKVLCTSKDQRNLQPSAKDLENADFFFSKIYNVDLQHLSPVHRVVDKLGCEAVFNKQAWITEIVKETSADLTVHNSSLNSKIDGISREAAQLNNTIDQGKKRLSTLDPKTNDTVKQEAKSIPVLKPIQRDIETKLEQNTSKGSKGNQEPSAEEVLKEKKSKRSASTSMPMADAVAKESNDENIHSFGETVIDKHFEVNRQDAKNKQESSKLAESVSPMKTPEFEVLQLVIGQDGQSTTDLSAHVLEQIKSESSDLRNFVPGEKTRVAENGTDSKPVQEVALSKTGLPDLFHTQVKQKLASMEKSVSSKQISVNGVISPNLVDADEQPVLNSKNISGLDRVKSLKKVVQDVQVMRALHKAEDTLQLNSMESKDLERQKEVEDTGIEASQQISSKANANNINIPDRQQNSSNLGKSLSGFIEADRSPIRIDNSTSQMRKNGGNSQVTDPTVTTQEHTSGISLSRKEPNGQENLYSRSLQEPQSSLKDFESQERDYNIKKDPRLASQLKSENSSKRSTTKEGPHSIEEVKSSAESDLQKNSSSMLAATKVEKRKLFKDLPWRENLQQGLSRGKVLLLQNLDPFLTSADVRDMLRSIFQGVSDAQVIPHEMACPYGQALVIFDTAMLADAALQEMETNCLVLASNKRPVLASKFKETTDLGRFPGHLALDKLKLTRKIGAEEYKKALSTSHSSQPNTIEYEMAMEWRRLQAISHTCRSELFEKQKKEIMQIMKGSKRKDS
ncbi:hypothetical protein KP509_1Z070700 [Ceratopteris richardii]|nr:hypothetical protein KP509_1Z070700 [Ceratopteris richardii]